MTKKISVAEALDIQSKYDSGVSAKNIWREFYQHYSYGQVWNIATRRQQASPKTVMERFTSMVPDWNKGAGCWEWHYEVNYPNFWDGASNVRAHIWAYRKFVALLKEGEVVRHKCDNPRCVRPSHLISGTHKDNMQDKIARGRANLPSGEKHHAVKISDADVERIRELRNSGAKVQSLADMFGVSKSTISVICNRKSRA